MANSERVRTDESGIVFVRSKDGDELRLAGIDRMHFFRLAGATPEEATDEQVQKFFDLRNQEKNTGERATEILRTESATDMVTRELRIFNLPQVMDEDNLGDAAVPLPVAPTLPQTMTAPSVLPEIEASNDASGPSLPTTPPGESGALPPAPRYTPGGTQGSQSATDDASDPTSSGAGRPATESMPKSRFIRQEGSVLYLQSPDGSEQRVTQYIRTHFLRMIEREISDATDEDIEMWFKLQGSLDAGSTLQEARSRNLLTEALQSAGKLGRSDLEVLQQSINAWLEARREDRSD